MHSNGGSFGDSIACSIGGGNSYGDARPAGTPPSANWLFAVSPHLDRLRK